MNKKINKLFINILVIGMILLPAISCSRSGEEKVRKENSNTQVKNEMIKAEMNSEIAKTTCTDCHKSNEKGDLTFRNKDGVLEFKQKVEEKTKHKPE